VPLDCEEFGDAPGVGSLADAAWPVEKGDGEVRGVMPPRDRFLVHLYHAAAPLLWLRTARCRSQWAARCSLALVRGRGCLLSSRGSLHSVVEECTVPCGRRQNFKLSPLSYFVSIVCARARSSRPRSLRLCVHQPERQAAV